MQSAYIKQQTAPPAGDAESLLLSMNEKLIDLRMMQRGERVLRVGNHTHIYSSIVPTVDYGVEATPTK